MVFLVNKNYRSGYRFELRVKKYLEARDYICFRSAGSHSPADIIALKTVPTGTLVYLIQCKHGTGRISNEELMKFAEIPNMWNVVSVLCKNNKKRRLQFIDIKLGIEVEM